MTAMLALDPLTAEWSLMEIVIAALIAVPLVGLIIGALSGRIRLTSCCAT